MVSYKKTSIKQPWPDLTEHWKGVTVTQMTAKGDSSIKLNKKS